MNTRENNVRTDVHVGTATTLWQASALLSDKESVTWKQKASYLNLGWLTGWLEPRGRSSLYERF